MTAKEKFEARLKELGLWEKWQKGAEHVGAVCLDGTIIILSHYCDDDPYTEDEFPPFNELRKNEQFRKECWNDFSCHKDSKFVADLARWLSGKTEICPLYPVDVYLPANGLEISSKVFEDDKDEPIDLELDTDDEEYQAGIDENRGKVELMERQLELFRKELVEMIHMELNRGHNLPEGWDPHPGWGALSFYGYAVENDTDYKIVDDMSIIFIASAGGVEKVSLSAPDFPIEVLFNIYNSMK